MRLLHAFERHADGSRCVVGLTYDDAQTVSINWRSALAMHSGDTTKRSVASDGSERTVGGGEPSAADAVVLVLARV
eukprot:4469522-Pleurochrysis_carterae.AAC.9